MRQSQAAERRELHLELADVVGAVELQTRHLALGAFRPDAALAARVAACAAGAAGRGAPQAAAELAEHALRLTPHDDAGRHERVLELAAYLEIAGEKRRLTELLEPQLESFPPGAPRARAFLLLISGDVAGNDDIVRYLEQGLAESGDDATSRGWLLAALSENVAAVRVEQIADAEAWALEALPSRSGAEPEARAARSLRPRLGSQPRRRLDRRRVRPFRNASPVASYIAGSPERVAAQRLVWRGEIERARTLLRRQLAAADERGEPSSYALTRLHLCELELRAGDWNAAERLLDDWALSAERELLLWPMYERCRALHAMGRGLPDEARRWAAEASAQGDGRPLGRARGATGARDHGAARARARPGRGAAAARVGAQCPRRPRSGCVPGRPELVEALLELGEPADASAVTARVRELAELQSHPWGAATALRCTALTALASRYDATAVADLEQAADDYSSLELRFDAARSLLALGRALRRLRKWGAARDVLEDAATAFDAIGSPGWTEAARAELDRLGARRPARAGEPRRPSNAWPSSRSRSRQQGDRPDARRDGEHRRVPPLEHLRQARHPLAGAARRTAAGQAPRQAQQG